MSARVDDPEGPRATTSPSHSLDPELVRQTRAVTLERPPAGRGRARRLLEVARLQCSKGGPIIDGIQCSQCPRFINASPSKDLDSLEVRCAWSSEDAIGEIMTRASVIASVASSEPLSAAHALLHSYRVKQLLVFDRAPTSKRNEPDHCVAGQITASQLSAPYDSSETVDGRMWIATGELSPSASVADAVDRFARSPVDCLPVIDRGTLVGLITRGDLIRVGVPTDLVRW